MMAYRQIHTKIWKDAWFLDLGAEAKLLFLYLCTNENTNILGLYELNLKVVAFETDLAPESIRAHLVAFQQAGKVDYEAGWVWVKNLMRYNATNLTSADVQKHIRKTLEGLPDTRLKMACVKYNTLPTPSIHPPETVPTPVVQEQEQEQYQEPSEAKQKQNDGADAPRLTAPVAFSDWLERIQNTKQRAPVLIEMHQTLFPGRDPPEYGYVNTVAKAVGGAGRLAELFWQCSSRPPTGDVLAYCRRIPKRTDGDDQEQGYARFLTGEHIGGIEH